MNKVYLKALLSYASAVLSKWAGPKDVSEVAPETFHLGLFAEQILAGDVSGISERGLLDTGR